TVEPGTGNILAMGQNKTYGPTDKAKGPITMINFAVPTSMGGANGFQAGSTMKPYTTMAWLESGHNMWDRISAPNGKKYPQSFKWKASCLPNGYATSGGGDKGWAPKNAVKGYPSSMSVDYGLFNSVNTATITEASKLDLCDIAKATERLGLVDYNNNVDPKTGEKGALGQPISPANPSFVIGSPKITPLAQATAFAALANNGEFCENRALISVTDASGTDYKVKPVDCRQEVSPQVVADMNGTMKKIASQKVAKGTIGYPIAGKTGTNNDANSTWFVGYTTGMTSAAWVGRYDRDQSMTTKYKEIAGVSRRWTDSGTWASPLWTNYMQKVGKLYPAKNFGNAKSAPKPPPPPKEEKTDSSKSNDSKSSDESKSAKDKPSNKPKNSTAPKEIKIPKDKNKGKGKDSSKKNSGSTKAPTPPKKTD
ncbi:MAG: penicillin-binding transpeptidase domain-containing protein, partial [Micrococcaceae bacterium]|nr:penicillin-binding transpeptidase domain-containing protein [Micrococcaceae bacterium]